MVWWFSNGLLFAALLLPTFFIVSLGNVQIDVYDDDMTAFNQMMEALNLTFTSATDLINRLNNFNKAKDDISSYGTKYPGATFEINRFSLMSDSELKQFMNASMSGDAHIISKRSALDNTISTSIPASFDFRTYGKVTPIKDQGQCGSCWAFSSTAAIESQYLLRFNQSLDLGEQNLVNCETTYSGGCYGGQPQGALYYAQTTGLPLESCYPYVGVVGEEDLFHPEIPVQEAQPCTDCPTPRYKIDGYRSYGSDETQLASYLYNYGPASMTFFVPRAFMSYKSGILDVPSTECDYNNNLGAHAITLVGYTADYWIAKNSWGTSWGENGFVRIKRGKGFCLMMTDIVAPYLNVATTTTKATTTPPTTTKASTTTAKPTQPVNCAGAIDLVFVIDGSDTMTATRFATIKSQLASAVTQSGIVWGPNNAHVGIVLSTGLFKNGATTPYRQIDLNGCQFYADGCTPTVTSTATLISAINNMQFSGGKNNIALSMSETLTGEYEGLPDSWYVFGGPYWGAAGDRPTVPNVMIVISGNDNSNVTSARNALAAQNVKVFSIGFSDLPTAQLQAISGSPASSFTTTGANLASVIKTICTSSY